MNKQLYVARRTFKAGGKVYYLGDIIEDISKVHRSTLRIKEEKVLPIPEDKAGIEKLHEYFAVRSSFNLKEKLTERASKGSINRGTKAPPASKSQTPPGTAAKVQAATPKAPPVQKKPKPLSGGSATKK